MTPISAPAQAHFRAYTITLVTLSVCLFIAAVLLVVLAVVIFGASYLFNDSGSVPQNTAPVVHLMFLDALIALILGIWQLIVRKHLAALQPKARISMLCLGAVYVIAAVINLWQVWFLSVPLAAIGIWWLIVFSHTSTRATFENPQPVPEILPPAI